MAHSPDFNRAIEARTGMTISQIARTPIAEIRSITERRHGFRTRFRSFWPLIGRGNIMHGRTKSRDDVEVHLDEALR